MSYYPLRCSLFFPRDVSVSLLDFCYGDHSATGRFLACFCPLQFLSSLLTTRALIFFKVGLVLILITVFGLISCFVQFLTLPSTVADKQRQQFYRRTMATPNIGQTPQSVRSQSVTTCHQNISNSARPMDVWSLDATCANSQEDLRFKLRHGIIRQA